MQMRRTALALALATAVTVPTVSIATAAFAKDNPAGSHHVGKPAKVAFTATGTITAVDTAAGTVTVAVKGGTKDVRGKTVTITVTATTRIRVGGARKTAADLAAGYRITVVGLRQDTVYAAVLIEAAAAKHTPAPAPSPAPSDGTTPEPSGSESRGS